MKLSILILTHKRPNLFARCLKSVLDQLPPFTEVIVNNDSCDIEEVDHPNVTYYYEKFDNLSSIYKFLLDNATGEFVYYLEDDDFLLPGFTFDSNADITACNYMPSFNPVYHFKAMTHYKNGLHTPEEFKHLIDLELLQLSQFIYRRSLFDRIVFPTDNNIHNDIRITLDAVNQSKEIRTMNKVLYCQTQDAGDNISFPETSTVVSITKDLGFLYG